MEVPEPPECPVCLGVYDSVSIIPRVLSCGHSTCELCIPQLANPFPNVIRCPSCTQLVKLPDRPSSLPKNIDLLRLSSSLQNPPDRPTKVNSQKPSSQLSQINDDVFVGTLWSSEFCLEWKDWVLPKDSVLLEKQKTEDGLFSLCGGKIVKSVNYRTKENQEVVFVKVGVFYSDESDKEEETKGSLCKFMYSYQSKIMKVLFFMEKSERDQLGLVLKASWKVNKVGRILGFWCNEDDDCVFIVCERFTRSLAIVGDLENESWGSSMAAFGVIGMELCEVVRGLHVEGLVVGCLGVSCFALDEYGHISADFSQILLMGRRICRMVDGRNADQKNKALQKYVFVCPEMLFEVLRNEGIELHGTSIYEVGYGSDVWSVACVLIWMLSGEQFAEEMLCYYDCLCNSVIDREGCDFFSSYTGWKEKLITTLDVKLGSELISLKNVLTLLSKCLEFDPGNRPTILEVWQCVRKLIFTPWLNACSYSEMQLVEKQPICCIGLSNLCQAMSKTKKGRLRQVAGSIEEGKSNGVDAYQDERLRAHGDVVSGLSSGLVKCIDLKAHLDCITGLAIGGGFLFSCSHDKMVNVWSLQDFSHVHSYRKHEHRVTAVVFVDEGEPLCISADNGGVICIWGATAPLDATPRHIISEQKDWRYSGIHALAISGTGYLYTGSGDKLIKAWSLKGYSLMCSMSGHRSVVSSLAVSGGILYSGSWDGTVRLWSLNDHSPVAVLGEDRPGNLSSVLSLAADGNLLLVAHENGYVMIWYDSVLLKSSKVHDGAVFSISKSGKWLFSGGWDKKIHVHELSGDGSQLQAIPIGSISCDSVVACIFHWERKLFVGQADKIVKVYHV